MDKAIVYAFDNEESKVVDANEVIGTQKERSCVECEQKLLVVPNMIEN